MAFVRTPLTSWAQLREHSRHGWLYRGHRCASWGLETSFERYCHREKVEGLKRPEAERLLLREFKRAYHDFHQHQPSDAAHMQWLALMQHHGAPTRALDFTYSIYVAAYFALEKATAESGVWAINAHWAVRASIELANAAKKPGWERLGVRWQRESDEQLLDALFIQPPHERLVCPLNPFLLNERLRAQRGAFLVPGDVQTSFVDNLSALPGHDNVDNVYCLVLPAAMRQDALRDLFHMNVSRASLFPGLDGYAQMLGVYHPTVVDPIQWKDQD